MEDCDRAARFLSELGREELAALLSCSTYRYVEEHSDWMNYSTWVIEVTSPKIYTEALAGLPDWEQKRIAEAINNTAPANDMDTSSDRLTLKSTDDEVADPLFPE